MNQTTLDFVQVFHTQIGELERARLRLAERATISSQPDAALDAASNAFTALQNFLQSPDVMKQQGRSRSSRG